MAQFKNGAPVYPKNGVTVNIYIPADQKEGNGFSAYSMSLSGDKLNFIGNVGRQGEMLKYYQVKSKVDKPDYPDPNVAIGTFTGKAVEFNGAIYQNISWNHEWFEHGFLGFNARLQRETVGNAYVLEREVQDASQTDIDKKEKAQKDKEFQSYLDGLLGGEEDKKVTASGDTGIKPNTMNILLGAIIVFVSGLIGYGVYRKFKKR
ncbi:hypothetical protein [Emticicia sp. 17c]|uniref:hypothetical protein n=1 Tax=Emticicia sp. 17c TaxID=3127704 RepID=UPI00301BBF1A